MKHLASVDAGALGASGPVRRSPNGTGLQRTADTTTCLKQTLVRGLGCLGACRMGCLEAFEGYYVDQVITRGLARTPY